MRVGAKVRLFFFVLLVVAGFWVWREHSLILERGLEALLNRVAEPNFKGTLDLEGVQLDSQLKVSIQKLTGVWQAPESFFPFEIHQIVLKDPLTALMFQKPAQIFFERLRPRGSSHEGVRGEVILNEGTAGAFKLRADFKELYLEEIADLDRENLKGASGRLAGDLALEMGVSGLQAFQMNLRVTEPGGRLQARFFDLLLPYLPPADQKALVLIKGAKTVSYREADFEAGLEGPEAIKLLLHIRVPDYNLNLNLNMKVQLESQQSLWELARLSGLVKAKSS